jgi:hypothetical protein
MLLLRSLTSVCVGLYHHILVHSMVNNNNNNNNSENLALVRIVSRVSISIQRSHGFWQACTTVTCTFGTTKQRYCLFAVCKHSIDNNTHLRWLVVVAIGEIVRGHGATRYFYSIVTPLPPIPPMSIARTHPHTTRESERASDCKWHF